MISKDKPNNTNIEDTSIYGKAALSQAYRILGFGDRDKQSPAYGCFDRYYWHYRQTDFVNIRFQEACLFLSCLYVYNDSDNRFYHHPLVQEWAIAALNYWSQLQHHDGSVDEYWPYERSFCATSFSLAAVAESCLLLSCPPPAESIHKACRWLSARDNVLVLNQMTGAAVALLMSGQLLQEDQWIKNAEQKMKQVLDLQSPEGYFEEYGGADIGYLTITLSYLARYYRLTQSEDVKNAAHRAFRFLDNKIEGNGTYDYSTSSRKTQYLYPFGFAVFEEWDLLSRHMEGLKRNEVLNPAWMDDRYCVHLSIDYIQTGMLNIENNGKDE